MQTGEARPPAFFLCTAQEREGNARSFYTFSRRRVWLLAHLRFSNPVEGSRCALLGSAGVSSTQQLELAMH